jgi:hypothetical protein
MRIQIIEILIVDHSRRILEWKWQWEMMKIPMECDGESTLSLWSINVSIKEPMINDRGTNEG